jgi:heat shock protein 4
MIQKTGVAGMTAAQLQAAADAETKLQAEMRDIEETENAQNDLESYIYNMRDKTGESGTYGEYILAADRDAFHSELMKAEDWLYDNMDAAKVVFVEKLAELHKLGEPAAKRFKAMEARTDYYPEVAKTIADYRALAENTEEKYAHIAAEKKQQILDECKGVEGWLAAKKGEQDALAKHLEPVLTVAMMQQKQQDIAQMADKIMAEPKPAPPVEAPAEKKEDKPADTAEAPAPEPEVKQEEVDAALDVD